MFATLALLTSSAQQVSRPIGLTTRDVADRQRIAGDLTPASYRAWRDFANSRGVTIAALLEAIGEGLADLVELPEERLPRRLRGTIARAREVGAERLRRGEPE